MTVREFVSKESDSANISIVRDGELLVSFDSAYWNYITDEILDMEVEGFTIETTLMKKPTISVAVPAEEAEGTDEGNNVGANDEQADSRADTEEE